MRIVRLSAECYSQRQVYRMLVVLQGCINKLLRRNLDSCRSYQRRCGCRRSLTTVQEDRQFFWMARDNNFILAARLHVEMIRWFWKSLAVRRIVNRYLATSCWCRDPTRFPGWRWNTSNAVVCWGNAQTVEPQAHEALCLQWWVSLHVLAVSQWWWCPYVPQQRGKADQFVRSTHGR